MSELSIEDYDYDFPEELIANKPASPRDSARLLVYGLSNKKACWDIFRNIDKYLPANAVLVLNETKVIPARLPVKKESGGQAKLLYISHDDKNILFLSDHKLNIGQKVFINKKDYLVVADWTEGKYEMVPSFGMGKLMQILEKFGEVPIPPYIKNSPLKGEKLKAEYQTVFAKRKGSVAAPTASLHFTNGLLAKLKRRGIAVRFITLHVNLGTFAPLREEQLKAGKLHLEEFAIDTKTKDFLNKAKIAGRPIIAVGTTVARTLESACLGESLGITTGRTDLFIRPGYKFKFIDGLITNFHVPKSSLMMLVAALTGREELLKIYGETIKEKARLFSFGDGMLIV